MNELISRKNCIIPCYLQVGVVVSGLGIDLRHRGYASKQDKHQLYGTPPLGRTTSSKFLLTML